MPAAVCWRCWQGSTSAAPPAAAENRQRDARQQPGPSRGSRPAQKARWTLGRQQGVGHRLPGCGERRAPANDRRVFDGSNHAATCRADQRSQSATSSLNFVSRASATTSSGALTAIARSPCARAPRRLAASLATRATSSAARSSRRQRRPIAGSGGLGRFQVKRRQHGLERAAERQFAQLGFKPAGRIGRVGKHGQREPLPRERGDCGRDAGQRAAARLELLARHPAGSFDLVDLPPRQSLGQQEGLERFLELAEAALDGGQILAVPEVEERRIGGGNSDPPRAGPRCAARAWRRTRRWSSRTRARAATAPAPCRSTSQFRRRTRLPKGRSLRNAE